MINEEANVGWCWHVLRGITQTVANTYNLGTAVLCGVFWWSYGKVVTNPLKLLYFIGPVWNNMTPEKMCALLNPRMDEAWFLTPEGKAQCALIREREFVSFDAKVYTILYFMLLGMTGSIIMMRVMRGLWYFRLF
jgi:hypothetical protein